MEPTDELTIILTVAEWSQILGVLGEVAYRVVAPLIAKINEQAAAQAAARAPPMGPRAIAD